MRKIIIILTLAIASCSQENKNNVNSTYLACYALDQTAKKECLQNIQFEAEKLGFKDFINNHNLVCTSIEDSPAFMEDKKAYQVTCKPKGQYLMQFNYETKQWKLIKENNHE